MSRDTSLPHARLRGMRRTACGGVCGLTPCPTLDDPRYLRFLASSLRRRRFAGRRKAACCRGPPDVWSTTAARSGSARATRPRPSSSSRVGSSRSRWLPARSVATTRSRFGACAPRRTALRCSTTRATSGRACRSTRNRAWTRCTTRVLVGDNDGLRLDVCGANNDARWDLVRTPMLTPRRVPTMTGRSAAQIRLADFTGDGLADMCTVTPTGLSCAAGDGTGRSRATMHIGSPTSPLAIEPRASRSATSMAMAARRVRPRRERHHCARPSTTGFAAALGRRRLQRTARRVRATARSRSSMDRSAGS